MERTEQLFYKVRCCSAATLVQVGIGGMHERSGGSLFGETRKYSRRTWSLLLEDVYSRDVNLDRCELEAELCRIVLEDLLKQLQSDGEAFWHPQSPAYQRVMAALYAPMNNIRNPFRAYCTYFQGMSLALQPWLEHPERDTVINALAVLLKHVLHAIQAKLEQEELPCHITQPPLPRRQPLPIAELVPTCPCCRQLMERVGRTWRCRVCEDFVPDTIVGGIAL